MESGEKEINKTTAESANDPPAAAPPVASKPFKGRYNCLNDPNTAPARIYVGNLSEQVTEEHLRSKFGKYGQIVDILLKHGFAFIQFMIKDSAMEAIANENKTDLLDKIIAVRTAVKKGDGETQAIVPNAAPTTTQTTQSKVPPAKVNLGPAAPHIGPMRKIGRGPLSIDEPSRHYFNHTADSNHIEIIAMTREVTAYAEKIEAFLKDRNLKVDVLYPRANIEMQAILESIKNRGTLFALEVSYENAQNNTVTVYLLYSDKIKWQKDMNIQDALAKVQEDSEKYIQPVLQIPKSEITSFETPLTVDSMEKLRQSLHNIVKQQQTTTSEMDSFIEYCRTLRKTVAILENPDNPLPEPEIPEEDPVEQQKRRKIDDILNTENYLDKLEGKREPFKMTKERLALLQDPQIERALDTLLHPDIFSTLDLSFIEEY